MAGRKSEIERLAEGYMAAEAGNDTMWGDEPPPPDKPKPGPPKDEDPWYPDLNSPTQVDVFEDPARWMLVYGEKGSGKTIGVLQKLVRHCYDNDNALAVIIAPSMRSGAEGAWHDLLQVVLPHWVEGIGLEHTDPKLDPNTKDRHLWIGTRDGGWSKVLLISIPHPQQVAARFKGPAPSFVFLEEATDTNKNGYEYFRLTSAQIGRRHGFEGVQQWVAACNPEDPEHWVYKIFWHDCQVEKGGRVWKNDREKPGIRRDSRYSVYYCPYDENKHRLTPEYRSALDSSMAGDPILRERLINGRWIARPSGDAIFRLYFQPDLHTRGDPRSVKRLCPHPSLPCILGYDLGDVNHAIVWLQEVPLEDRTVWMVFDELLVNDTKIALEPIVRAILRKMNYWGTVCNTSLSWFHVSDKAAFDRFRAIGGSYDHLEVQRISRRELQARAAQYPFLDQPIRLEECPKPQGSVASRIRMGTSLLQREEILIDSHCKHVIEMFNHLESDKNDAFKPKRGTAGHLHIWDALSYPIFRQRITEFHFQSRPAELQPRLYQLAG